MAADLLKHSQRLLENLHDYVGGVGMKMNKMDRDWSCASRYNKVQTANGGCIQMAGNFFCSILNFFYT